MDNNLDLIQIIRDRLNESPQQRITFAEYMELVLYHPHYGYYASKEIVIGESGDFLTSPHLADDFGEMLAIHLQKIWEYLGNPDKFTIVEMGAGSGKLAAQILGYTQQQSPQLFRAIDYIIIETAPAMKVAQQEYLQDLSVRWLTLDEIADRSIVGCFLSNELIDAFPVHQVTLRERELQEIYVTYDLNRHTFVETIGELSTDRLLTYWQLNNINLLTDHYADGYRTEVNLAALAWLEKVATKLARGVIISIDYGYSADRYYNPMRSQGTLQCYYRHAHHNDAYINIGHQDLTAHVDFTALQYHGERLGLQTVGFTQQGIYLVSLGLGDRIAAISSAETTDVADLLRRRQHLHQLIDPMGLGRFGVLIQARGLSESELELLSTDLVKI
jgi:SAM-dependent MidA family methyltransferase